MKKFAFTAVFIAVAGAASFASAGLQLNGLSNNGTHLNALIDNGLQFNAIGRNGLIDNGVRTNALIDNGIQFNGTRLDANRPRPDAPAQEVPDVPQREYVASITLPGGRTLTAQ